jgi:hypothetical protein
VVSSPAFAPPVRCGAPGHIADAVQSDVMTGGGRWVTAGAWWRSATVLMLVVAALLLARVWSRAPVQAPLPTTIPGGNGVAQLPPPEILEAARTALVEARSVRLRGDFDDAGTPISMDVLLLAEGDASGWVASEGRRFRVINTGGRTYLRGRKALEHWANATVADYVGDRWVLVPDKGDDLPGAMDLVQFADQTLGPEAGASFVTGPTDTVGGRPAIRLDGVEGSWWIALTGPPYPLRLETRVAVDGPVQHLDLSEFDSHAEVNAPKDPIDLAELD